MTLDMNNDRQRRRTGSIADVAAACIDCEPRSTSICSTEHKFLVLLDEYRADSFLTRTGHANPAHLLRAWKNTTFDPTVPVISTRGPEIIGEKVKSNGKAMPILASKTSNTLLFHTPRNMWSGEVLHTTMVTLNTKRS